MQQPSWAAVFCHAYNTPPAAYTGFTDRLADIGCVEVLRPVFPGHTGKSDAKPVVPTVAEFAAVIQDCVHELRVRHPELPVIVCGHSMGAVAVLAHGRVHPGEADGRVLYAPMLASWPPVRLTRQELPPELWPALEQVASTTTLLTEVTSPDAVLSEPVLWEHGEHDPLAPFEEVSQRLRPLLADDVSAVVVEGQGHMLLNKRNGPPTFARLAGFASSVERTTRRLHGSSA